MAHPGYLNWLLLLHSFIETELLSLSSCTTHSQLHSFLVAPYTLLGIQMSTRYVPDPFFRKRYVPGPLSILCWLAQTKWNTNVMQAGFNARSRLQAKIHNTPAIPTCMDLFREATVAWLIIYRVWLFQMLLKFFYQQEDLIKYNQL